VMRDAIQGMDFEDERRFYGSRRVMSSMDFEDGRPLCALRSLRLLHLVTAGRPTARHSHMHGVLAAAARDTRVDLG
jgi:hypothetical protein